MFTPVEDKILETGPIWHGTAIGWVNNLETNTSKLPAVSERFCGIKYSNEETGTKIVAFSAYLPTSGSYDEFLEVLSQLSSDIQTHVEKDDSILIGLDSNQSSKST